MNEIKNLEDLKSGTKEQTDAVNNLAKIYQLKIEDDKNKLDLEEKRDARECDDILRKDQLEEEVKNRYFRIGVDIAGIIVPIIFYGAWMNKGFKFEETGTFTSRTFMNLISRFKSTK